MKLHELLNIIYESTDSKGWLDIENVLCEILKHEGCDIEYIASLNGNLENELDDIKKTSYDEGYEEAEKQE